MFHNENSCNKVDAFRNFCGWCLSSNSPSHTDLHSGSPLFPLIKQLTEFCLICPHFCLCGHIKMHSFFSYLVLTYLSSYCWGGLTVSPMMSTYNCFTYLYSGTYISYFMLFTARGNNNSISGRKQSLAFNNWCFIYNIFSASYVTVGQHILVCICKCPIPVKGYGYKFYCVMLWCECSTTWNTLISFINVCFLVQDGHCRTWLELPDITLPSTLCTMPATYFLILSIVITLNNLIHKTCIKPSTSKLKNYIFFLNGSIIRFHWVYISIPSSFWTLVLWPLMGLLYQPQLMEGWMRSTTGIITDSGNLKYSEKIL
jgi:hypothetical protein